jgi:hypothetical protein
MAFIHSKSSICIKSELDIFALPPKQSIEDAHSEIIKPLNVSSNESSAIEFVIPGNNAEYLELSHTQIHAKLQILKANDGALAAADSAAPINYIVQTMFSNVEVYLNNR